MAEEQQQAPPHPETAAFAAAVNHARLADYCAESPQAWFRCIASTFAIANITNSKTKFHMAVAKLPISLMDSIGHLCDNPNRVPDPYTELQNILIRSYGLSDAQKTARLLDHPGLGCNKPSVMWDQLAAMRPDDVDVIMRVLFLRKLPAYIRDVINPKDHHTAEDLTQRCNEIWENRAESASAVAAAVHRPTSPARGNRRSSSPFRGRKPAKAKPSHRRSPTPAAARGGQDTTGFCFYHARFLTRAQKCEPGCTYQENE